ncbi:TPA: hypothetical protein N0F65_007502 [Lagenidium giganteum]|uniref:Uncharacterized protein n=1 Tax=Lagenidium giganteum TaxID=4803 RepID=A0AAV2ZIM2_9STRA|nr:TPA: hypothetical protein N0F65_007502 [Lagenidium giganteum]
MNMVEEAHLKRQECLKAEHAEDITRVREAMEELEKQHRQYEITHSKSDAEMRQREEELRQRIARMESETNEERAAHATEIKSLKTEITVATLQAQQDATLFKEQERTLKDTIRAQLTATTALNETNQRLKSEVQKKSAAMIQLENRTATLESKLLSLEKERAHYTNQEERHRGAHAVDANYSSQLNSHVARVMSEFEALNEAHKALKANCRCSKEGPSRAVSKSNEADGKEGTTGNTSYYIDRLVKMKEQVSQEEDKRRELLFVNAQLILEQKQFQVKNKQQSEELRQLKEKLQTWLLRDERRRKEHEDLQLKVHALEGRLKQSSAQSIPQQSMASKSERDVQAPTEPHDAVETTIPGIEFPVENRSDVASPTPSGKRQREEDENIDPHVNDNDSKRAKVASEAGEGNESTFVAKLQASSQPPAADTETNTGSVRPKRRLSHFMSKRMQTSAATPSNPAPDKPSECQQQ